MLTSHKTPKTIIKGHSSPLGEQHAQPPCSITATVPVVEKTIVESTTTITVAVGTLIHPPDSSSNFTPLELRSRPLRNRTAFTLKLEIADWLVEQSVLA